MFHEIVTDRIDSQTKKVHVFMKKSWDAIWTKVFALINIINSYGSRAKINIDRKFGNVANSGQLFPRVCLYAHAQNPYIELEAYAWNTLVRGVVYVIAVTMGQVEFSYKKYICSV